MRDAIDQAAISGSAAEFDRVMAVRVLRAACRRLSGKRRLSSKIEGAINALVALHQVAPRELMTPPPAFSDAGVATTERELQQLIKGVQVLHVAVANLHEPAIKALARVGFNRKMFINQLEAVLAQVTRAKLPEGQPGVKRGPKPDAYRLLVARAAGRLYQDVTGLRPTYTTNPVDSTRSGAWPRFLGEVFDALGVGNYGDRLMRRVADEMRPQGTNRQSQARSSLY